MKKRGRSKLNKKTVAHFFTTPLTRLVSTTINIFIISFLKNEVTKQKQKNILETESNHLRLINNKLSLVNNFLG